MSKSCLAEDCTYRLTDSAVDEWCVVHRWRITLFTRQRLIDALRVGNAHEYLAALRQAQVEARVPAAAELVNR